MPQDLPRPLTLAPPAVAQVSWTERVVLHGWIVAIIVGLLWMLLS